MAGEHQGGRKGKERLKIHSDEQNQPEIHFFSPEEPNILSRAM